MTTLLFHLQQVAPSECSPTDPHPDVLELSGWGRQMVRELEAFLSGALAVKDMSPAETEKQDAGAGCGCAMSPLSGLTTQAEYEPC